MSLENHKITTAMDNVSRLPDYPSDAGYTAAKLKAVFDGGDKEIKQKFNALIDELVSILAELEQADTSAAEAAKKYTDTAVSGHNKATDAHGDIRSLISELTRRLNAAIDSDDITLDQLSEIVAYIKDNRSLIEVVTTRKANAVDVYNRNVIDTMLTERDAKISELTRRLNAAIDSDDITLDQLSELVAYIKDNRGLIETVTTSKANSSEVYTRSVIDTKLTEKDNRISELEEDVGDMDTALDSVIASQESILAMQNALIGGDA